MRGAGERRRAFRWGLGAETVAAWLLRLKGYTILGRRIRMKNGEVDLIARRAGTVVFVEVKARGTNETAAEAITPRQQRRIVAAAEAWLARHPSHAGATLRFDAVLVAPRSFPRHIVDAFSAGSSE
jgi:putative endonuclease